jgi:ATP-dependent Clp protease ATP-binding subunit ClpA
VDKVCWVRLRASGIPPEIVGRFSSFLIFRPLDERSRVEIVAMAIQKIATEYGLQLRRIAPSVVAAILRRAGSGGFGVRPYEYLVDGLLGNIFSEAAAVHGFSPLEIRGGPPFECIPFYKREATK